jgi:hypothetical protein
MDYAIEAETSLKKIEIRPFKPIKKDQNQIQSFI